MSDPDRDMRTLLFHAVHDGWRRGQGHVKKGLKAYDADPESKMWEHHLTAATRLLRETTADLNALRGELKRLKKEEEK